MGRVVFTEVLESHTLLFQSRSPVEENRDSISTFFRTDTKVLDTHAFVLTFLFGVLVELSTSLLKTNLSCREVQFL